MALRFINVHRLEIKLEPPTAGAAPRDLNRWLLDLDRARLLRQ
jgi:hypothetical protein